MEKVAEQKTAEQKELSREEILDASIKAIENNEFTIHFFCPAMNQPSGGIGVLLRIAAAYQQKGHKVKVWYEPMLNQQASVQASQQAKKEVPIYDVFNPTWIDFDISGVQFYPLGASDGEKILFTDGKERETFPLHVAIEDFFFIPEGFPNIMERTVGVPCKRIVLAQSWLYILAGMRNGQIWQHFGINDVVTVSDCITQYLSAIMPGIQIKPVKQGIDRNTFYPPKKMSEKYPMIGFQSGRGPESQMKTQSIIKMFYAANPHMRWWRFIELGGMPREQFAERLRDCAFVLYTDEIAGFGTLPLEAMASGTHVIGYDAPGGQEYATNENGFWIQNGNVFQAAELLGHAVEEWVTGRLDNDEIQASYEKTLENYTVEGEKKRIYQIIEEYKKERIDELSRAKKA